MWSPWKFVLAALLVLLTACSNSPVPIVDPAESTLDARLFGSWAALDGDSQSMLRIRVVPFDEHQMVAGATYVELVDGGYEVHEALYRVLLADVDGATWISASELSEKDTDSVGDRDPLPWLIARIDFEQDGIVLFRELAHSIDLSEIETVEGLTARLRERQNDPGFLDDEALRFVRHDDQETTF
jgi:hypothetical protein